MRRFRVPGVAGPRSVRLIVGALCVSGLMAACSSEGASTPSSTSAQVSSPASSPAASASTTSAPPDIASAVTVAMQRWASADTPAKACAAVSDGFAMFLGDGSVAQCVTHVAKNAGPLYRGTAHVTRVTLDGSQAIATATITGPNAKPNNFYFVKADGVWKLNSIGQRH